MTEWTQIIIRSILFVITLFAITKLGGKKQLAELSFFEYVSGITVGSIAGEVIMGLEANIFHGVLAVLIFGGFTYLVDVLGMKSKSFRNLIDGKASVLIQDGKILEENMKKEKYTIDELNSLLRQKDVFKVSDVEFAVLEPKGDLSVLLKRDKQPVTPSDLGIQVAPEKETKTIIMDGKIMNDPLSEAGKNRGWLDNELAKLGVTIENVFMGQVDSAGQLIVDTYDDKITIPTPQPKQQLLAMMKKCQADLELFALETESLEAKEMYNKNAERLLLAIEKTKRYLKN
ncbi:DUF421 domain-containing protein [Bacillus sp. REN3]|uniref:DUF421 domain-containing protein n=1 Tax=Bacillus sp. REN3 TaxID=2802440 RepID=UPI001AEE1E77|nr:DUF421 domain-containing protein [Bacillus sp. REN3]